MSIMNSKRNLLEVARNIYRPLGIKNALCIIKFLFKARKHECEIKKFETRLSELNIPVTLEMLGTLEWPYIHNEWDVATKLNAIATHYEILSETNPRLTQIRDSMCFQLCDFSDMSEGVVIGIDYAEWFTREGELVINIFRDDLRVASMAFTISRYDGDVVAYIGAVQGIHGGVSTDESLEIYRILTKDFEGLRPRSLLLEVLKVVAHQLGAKKLLGVSEQNRHHRHQYFGNDQKTEFKNDYNTFWEEHNGVFNPQIGFYEISMEPAIKDLSEITAKKRGQYRLRYKFIASLEHTVSLS